MQGKYKTKIGMYTTIDINVMNEFKRLSDENAINRSKLIENFLKQYIKEHKTK